MARRPGRLSSIAGAALVGLLSGCGPAGQTQAGAGEARAQELGFTGALDFDCSHGGRTASGVEVFIVSCARAVASPDGKWRLVNTGLAEPGDSDDDYVFVEDISGRRIGAVPGLSDAMPFAVFWSPRPGWFFVDHHAGSFMQVPEAYEITPRGVTRREGFLLAGQDAARDRFPCLPELDREWANGNVLGWSRDGRRLAWVLRTRIDVCVDPDHAGPIPADRVVHPLMMVSDLDSGRVIDGSVVVLDDEEADDFAFPRTAPYRAIVTPG